MKSQPSLGRSVFVCSNTGGFLWAVSQWLRALDEMLGFVQTGGVDAFMYTVQYMTEPRGQHDWL